MNSIYLPIIGQGSQPQEEDGAELAFMPLPNTMTTYVMPQLPPDLDVKAMTRAKALFQAVLEALKNYQSGQISVLTRRDWMQKNWLLSMKFWVMVRLVLFNRANHPTIYRNRCWSACGVCSRLIHKANC
jgi:hypothetical protein